MIDLIKFSFPFVMTNHKSLVISSLELHFEEQIVDSADGVGELALFSSNALKQTLQRKLRDGATSLSADEDAAISHY